jgi:hypothetical protein
VRKHYSEKISERIRETLVANDTHNKRLDKNIKDVYEIISNYDNSEQFLEVATSIFDKISEISIKMSNKIKTFNNECLEDYEVAYSKIVSINNLLNNRLDLDRDFAYVIYYLDRNPSSVIDYLKSYLFVNRYSSNYEITDSIREKISQDFSKLDYLFRFTDRL